MVLTAYNALSPVTGLCCHRRLAELPLRNLTPASGRQDHTTSPYAAALSSGPKMIEPDATASIASRAQRVVTIAIRPSQRARDGASSKSDLPDSESGKFLQEGLDSLGGGSERGSDLPAGQIGSRSPHKRSDMRDEKKNKSRIWLHSSGLHSQNMCSNAMGFCKCSTHPTRCARRLPLLISGQHRKAHLDLLAPDFFVARLCRFCFCGLRRFVTAFFLRAPRALEIDFFGLRFFGFPTVARSV